MEWSDTVAFIFFLVFTVIIAALAVITVLAKKILNALTSPITNRNSRK